MINISKATTNLTLLFFILVPVVPFLAAQINYGGLVLAVTALAILLTLKFRQVLNGEHKIPISHLLLLLAVGMLGCLVQFQFLPILAAIGLYILVLLYKFVRSQPKIDLATIKTRLILPGKVKLIAISAFFLLASGLFLQQYGTNAVKYHNLVPQCGQVLSVERCMAYAPYARNYLAQQHKTSVDPNPIKYSLGWVYRMAESSFFTQSGGVHPNAMYVMVHPLPGLIIPAAVFLVFGGAVFLRYNREIFRQYPALKPLLFIAVFYIGALWARNYYDFLQLGQKLAINGRYFVPVLLILLLVTILAYSQLLKHRHDMKFALVMLVFFFALQGGGALSFIYASNQYWYWPAHSKAIESANSKARNLISPIIF